MVDVKYFFKENRKSSEKIQFSPSDSFEDETGKAVECVLRKISAERNAEIVEDCTTIKKGEPKVDNDRYTRLLVAECVVEPNLNDVDLQNNYGVKSAEDLVQKIWKDAGEWLRLVNKINSFNGFKNLDDESEELGN